MGYIQERNKLLISRVMQAVFVERDPLGVMHLFSDSYAQHNPYIDNGKAAIVEFIARLPSHFAYQPGMMIAEEDKVMVHGRYQGWGPVPLIAVDIFRIESGMLVEHWDVMQEEIIADAAINGNEMFSQKELQFSGEE